jgi:hypothetical protein
MRNTSILRALLPLGFLFGSLSVGCSDDGVSSDEEARRAYLGLDSSIEKALGLGMDGFNAASSANIPEQMTTGDVTGTMVVSGQVDQGVSPNKEMRLLVALVDYSDGPAVTVEEEDINITYDTDAAALPALDLSLRNIPDGTFTGTLLGTYSMSGDLDGSVTLNLTMSGEIESDGTGGIRRKLGTTHVTGTATSGDGTYNVELMI